MGPGRRNESLRRHDQREGNKARQQTTRQKAQKERRKRAENTNRVLEWSWVTKQRQTILCIHRTTGYNWADRTQTKDKHWEKLKRNLSEKINWECQYALREKNKGRASSGIITEIKKWTNEKETVQETNNIQERKIIIQKGIQKE